MGWPLTAKEYGGAWIYGSKDNVVSLGFVTGLDYPDPRLDPQHVLQEFKKHPFIASLLAGEDDSIRGQVFALWRLVGRSPAGRQWLDDSRRFRGLTEFPAVEGHSPGHQKRHARGRNGVSSLAEERFLVGYSRRLPARSRVELD